MFCSPNYLSQHFFPKKVARKNVDFEKNYNILLFKYRFGDNFSVLVYFSENFPFNSRLNPRKFSSGKILTIVYLKNSGTFGTLHFH
jgi:hypothetical protein